jgi:hypothetical protein
MANHAMQPGNFNDRQIGLPFCMGGFFIPLLFWLR